MHSAVVANLYFYLVVEKQFLAAGETPGLELYGRYHDDIILIAASLEENRSINHALRRLAFGVFKLDTSQVAIADNRESNSLEYLDLKVVL